MFPRLLHIGEFSLPTYGFMAAFGLLVGLTVAVRNCKRQGVNEDYAWNLGILAVLSAVIGAKLLFILDDWNYYLANPRALVSFDLLRTGGWWEGGVIAALVACVWYMRKHRMKVLAICDAFAPGIALGHAFGRIGCFAAGCCWGKPTDLPWGVTFTSKLAQQWVGTPLGVSLQPTQIYESLFEFLNFAFLAWLFRRHKFDGQVIGAYLITYGIARFFFEFLRGDPDRGNVFGIMSLVQLIMIFFVLGGGILWMRGGTAPVPVVAGKGAASRGAAR